MKHIKVNPFSTDKTNYFYFIIVFGQCLGVLPLIREDVGKAMVLKFKAASLKVLYCAIHIFCVMLMMMMCIFHAAKNGFHFGDIGKKILLLLSMFCFFHISPVPCFFRFFFFSFSIFSILLSLYLASHIFKNPLSPFSCHLYLCLPHLFVSVMT